MLNNQTQMYLKLLQKEKFQKPEETGDLIGNKITNKITKVLSLENFNTEQPRDSYK